MTCGNAVWVIGTGGPPLAYPTPTHTTHCARQERTALRQRRQPRRSVRPRESHRTSPSGRTSKSRLDATVSVSTDSPVAARRAQVARRRTRRATTAIAELCEHLTATKTCYPGTDLILRYEIKTRP